MAKQQKFYVVWKGVEPGIYSSWTDCQLQIKTNKEQYISLSLPVKKQSMLLPLRRIIT